MLFPNFKLAWRNLIKNKVFSLINIGGFALGLAVCWLIAVFISNERKYDQFHQHKDRLVRLTMEYSMNGTVSDAAVTGTKPGPFFHRTFPEIESYCRTYMYNRVVKNGNEMFDEKRFLYADSAFFHMFSFPLINGDKDAAIADLNSIAISETTAKKYFASTDVIGKTLRLGEKDLEVKAVFEDVPDYSQLKFDFVTRFENLGGSVVTENWWSANWVTYFLVKDAGSIAGLRSKIDQLMLQDDVRKEARVEGSSYLKYFLEPITDVHLYSKLAGFEPNGNIKHVYAFAIVALLVLLIGCANYTNLATAQAMERVSEIGVRKAMGASRQHLFFQFIGEASVLVMVSGIVAIALAWFALPFLNSFTGKNYGSEDLFEPSLLFTFVGLLFLVATLSGLYPAWIIARNKGKLSSGQQYTFIKSNGFVRNGLVVFQFAISVFLIVYTGVFYRQMNMMKEKDLGYDREHVIVLPLDGKMRKDITALRESLLAMPEVEAVTAAYETPENIEWGDGINVTDENGKRGITLNAIPVDLDFASTMKIELLAGRDFNPGDFSIMDTTANYANFKQPYIINEALAKKIGWEPENAIGKTIEKNFPGPVVGVVKDFHFRSLHEQVEPLLIFLSRDMAYTMMVRLRGSDIASSVASLGNWWKSRVPHRPFEYKFLDDNYNSLYEAEQRNTGMLQAASFIAIFLGLIGLFGMAAYNIRQRRKEIGIRRVLGAGIGSIIFTTSRKMMLLVLMGGLIAAPVAWYLANQWLQEFAYRVQVNPLIVIASVAVVLLLAFVITTVHAIQSALGNPVKNIREV